MSVRYIIGDAVSVMRSLQPGSVDCLITSPPYPWQRSYLPGAHPDKDLELGQEATPAAALGALLTVMDAAWDLLSDDATFWVNLGDVHAGSGSSGGDYDEGGMREGQAKWMGTARRAGETAARMPWKEHGRPDRRAKETAGIIPHANGWRATRDGWPRSQSVCWISHLFGASLAYGLNLLNGEPCQQWVTRPPVTWCKPSPSVGRLDRKFRTATELLIYGGKHQGHFFDLDAVREPHADPAAAKREHPQSRSRSSYPGGGGDCDAGESDRPYGGHRGNEKGAPPKNWWVVAHPGYSEAHFATFPPELIVKPVRAGCPVGGTILDPFAGSGTTGIVAHGHGRDAILIDLDERNVHLARERIGMFLEVDEPNRTTA